VGTVEGMDAAARGAWLEKISMNSFPAGEDF
jgi:hypothetical protein